MGNQHVLSATGVVKIQHRLGQVAVAIKRAQEVVALQKRSLRDEPAARLETIELGLAAALVSAHLSILLFKSARPSLHPMDAAEAQPSENATDNGQT